MLGRAEVLRRMLVLGIVAASDVAAGATQPKMHPRVAHGEVFLAAGGVWAVRIVASEWSATHLPPLRFPRGFLRMGRSLRCDREILMNQRDDGGAFPDRGAHAFHRA